MSFSWVEMMLEDPFFTITLFHMNLFKIFEDNIKHMV